ncbi:hypothetical protein DFH27DRAFT_651641 [Peziza echinospora]|nr:hypothetical protein DFH27DRAFT_651641 [Peziza echinospora]
MTEPPRDPTDSPPTEGIPAYVLRLYKLLIPRYYPPEARLSKEDEDDFLAKLDQHYIPLPQPVQERMLNFGMHRELEEWRESFRFPLLHGPEPEVSMSNKEQKFRRRLRELLGPMNPAEITPGIRAFCLVWEDELRAWRNNLRRQPVFATPLGVLPLRSAPPRNRRRHEGAGARPESQLPPEFRARPLTPSSIHDISQLFPDLPRPHTHGGGKQARKSIMPAGPRESTPPESDGELLSGGPFDEEPSPVQQQFVRLIADVPANEGKGKERAVDVDADAGQRRASNRARFQPFFYDVEDFSDDGNVRQPELRGFGAGTPGTFTPSTGSRLGKTTYRSPGVPYPPRIIYSNSYHLPSTDSSPSIVRGRRKGNRGLRTPNTIKYRLVWKQSSIYRRMKSFETWTWYCVVLPFIALAVLYNFWLATSWLWNLRYGQMDLTWMASLADKETLRGYFGPHRSIDEGMIFGSGRLAHQKNELYGANGVRSAIEYERLMDREWESMWRDANRHGGSEAEEDEEDAADVVEEEKEETTVHTIEYVVLTNINDDDMSASTSSARRTRQNRSEEPPPPPSFAQFYPVTRDNLDTLKVVSEAAGLTPAQLKALSLTWVEVRQFIKYLATQDTEYLTLNLDSTTSRRAYRVAAETLQSVLSNIYYSRLWEQEYGILRYGHPLRQVHNFYMLQLQEIHDPEIILGGRGQEAYEALQAQKQGSNEKTPYTYPFFCHLGDFDLPKDLHIHTSKKRFPQSITHSHFWGMLQIYWVVNLEKLVTVLPLLSQNEQLLKMVDRLYVNLDKYYKASGFIPISEANDYTEVFAGNHLKFDPINTPKTSVSGRPIPGIAFSSKKDYQKPIDPFRLWRQHLTGSEILHGFDWTLGDYIVKQHGGNTADSVRMAKTYARAQYLTRVCEFDNNDAALSGWLNTLTQALINNDFDVFTQPAAEDTVLEFRSLDDAHTLEERTIRSSSDVARLLQTAAEDTEKTPEIAPAIYTVLAHNFYLLHVIRTNLSLIVDTMGDELALVELTKTTGNAILFETDVTNFWLRVAAQFGYIAPNDAKSDGIMGVRVLLPLPTWVEEVEAENARIRRRHVRRTMAEVIKQTRVTIEKKIGIYEEDPIPAPTGRRAAPAAATTAATTTRTGRAPAPAPSPAPSPAPATTTRAAPTSRRARAV